MSRRVLHVTTVPMSLAFLRGQVGYMRSRGVEILAISSPGPELDAFGAREGVPVVAVPMPRRITPFGDLVAIVRLYRATRSFRPDIVHAHTPKGGLLGMIAATAAGVAGRVYHMRGLPMMTATGFRRRLLRATEWIACRLAHRVLSVSASLRDVAVAEGLCPAGKIEVLLAGSGNGVDADVRFDPDRIDPDAREATRARLGIPRGALVVGFVGRLVRDKGIIELADAWRRMRPCFPTARLLLVGPFEEGDAIPEVVAQGLRQDSFVHLAGTDWNTPLLYAAMDVVALPTYREGFPNVPLEAAAMRLPVVATRVPGCVDAVAHGVTGTLVPPRDAAALAAALSAYLDDPALRRAHGDAGRERVLRDFRQERLWEALHTEYELMLTRASSRSPRAPISALIDTWAKRVLDVTASVAALIVLAPLLAGVAMLVWADLGGNVLFRQQRPGRFGRAFTLYKFRTMRDFDGVASSDDETRLTTLGRFLRDSSLDELPELWNVLRGDMSLVGPRPLLMEYLPLYNAEQARRHDVRPGITGWAQVHGRNTVPWSDRFALDVWYVANRTFALDLRILARTLWMVLVREGITEPGQATMRRFRGSAG